MDVPPPDLPFPPPLGQFRHVLAGEASRDVDTLLRQDVVDVITEVLALDGAVRPMLLVDDVQLLDDALYGGEYGLV
ncbi:hypothetical protein [Streptomyces sp. NPDC058891]|uniref:hypothetical protein n=1 Tax=Streptomyces sp. NPDC058891 TaxID=3346667 RepID=UPI0036CD3D32